ncbi:MAG: glycosyltransferase family 4 protein [Pseudomonadales bacterium]
MKLALCLFKYFPYGGLQRNFLAIARELMARSHDVVIYTGSWEGERPEGLQVVILPTTGFTNYSKNHSIYRALQKSLLQRPVDLVVGFNKMPGLDVYYCADTCFATKVYKDKHWLYRLTPRSRWSLKYERAVFDQGSSTEVLLLSASEGDAFKKYYATQQQRFHLMPPGISRTRVRVEASDIIGKSVRCELNVSEKETLIAFLGSDYKRKGLDRLLRAVAALPNAEKHNTKIVVIGRDKRLPVYEKLATNLGIHDNVLFVGQRDDVPNLLFAADCLAHPAYLENTGNALLEGVVAGLPVICTAICGYAFYIEQNDLGVVVSEPFSQHVMNQQLKHLLNSRDDWRSHCAAFAASADIYSRPQRVAERIEAIGEQRCQ